MEQCVGSACGMGHGIALLLSPVARNNPAHMCIESARLQSIFPLHQNILRFCLCFSSHLSSQALFNFWSSSVQPSWPYSGQTFIAPRKGRLRGWSRHAVHFCSCVLPCCQAERSQGDSTGSLDAFREKEMVSRWPTLCPPQLALFCTFDPITFTTIIHCSLELFCSSQIL